MAKTQTETHAAVWAKTSLLFIFVYGEGSLDNDILTILMIDLQINLIVDINFTLEKKLTNFQILQGKKITMFYGLTASITDGTYCSV
jgi:hypothetical protein